MRFKLTLALCGVLLFRSAWTIGFDAAEPVWTVAERDEINSSVAFTTYFDWDGKSPLQLRLAGCSIFKVFVNGEFAAYGPARGPHGWFRMDEWDISRVARKGANRLSIVGVAYNTTTYYIVGHEPFLQAEVLSGGKVVRATGDGEWDANFTERVRKAQRYSLQRAQSEVYEVSRHDYWEWWKRDGFLSKSLIITNAPSVKLLERGAPYPKFEIDGTYRPTDILAVSLRTGDLGDAPHLWDEKSSRLGRTYPTCELKYLPAVDWWKRLIEPKARFKGMEARVDATSGVRYEGAINDTGFLRLKVKVTKPGRLLVGFDEILVNGKLDFLKRFGCNNVVMWDVKEPGEYDFESFEPYTFKFAEVIMLEGEATVEKLEMRTYKNPNATRTCALGDPADRKIFEAARETFAQNAVDVFTDCPSRERAGWLCDSYFTGQAEHFFTGKNEIERTFLRNFALAEKFPNLPEGMVPMCYPGDTRNYIPNWSMWFVLELANYFERTGDRETVDILRPRVEGLLKFYAQYLNLDGALENLPAWVFVEWSHANDKKLTKDGVNWPSNMTYAEVLEKAARLYGRPELAEQAKKLKSLICERSYDGTWFRDNAKHPDVTETCQYYAFFHGVATPSTHPELWKRLADEFGPERQAKGLYKEVWPSNAFIGNLLRLILLKREGRVLQVSREIRGYYLKMAEATGTLWEHDRPEASCNHGFASYLAILLGDPFWSATAPRQECRVRLKMLPRNNMPLVEAEVDGAKGTFLFDTGATHTTFDIAFVKKNMPRTELVPVAMMADSNVDGAPRYMRVKSMKLGEAEFCDFGAMALDISHLHRSIGARVDGILGMSTIGRVPCIVAFGANEVVFAPGKESVSGFMRPVQRSLSDPMSVLLPVKFGERTFELLVDSGASFTFFSRETGWPTTGESVKVPAVNINGAAALAPLVGKKGVLPVGDGVEVSPLVVPGPMNCIGADVLTSYDMLIAGRYVSFRRRTPRPTQQK